MSDSRQAIVVWRETSRHGAEYFARVSEALPKAGIRIAAAHSVRKRKVLRRRVREVSRNGAPLIVVIGGDGSQAAAVREIARTRAVLGVIPAGTGNSFAYSLGLGEDVDKAVATIAHGKVAKVDVGLVNGCRFANFATIGLIADAADHTAKPLKQIAGALAYGAAGIASLIRDRSFELRVKSGKRRLRMRTYQAIVACGRYYGHQPLAPGAGLCTGELAFFAAWGESPQDALRTNTALLRGDHLALKGAQYFSSAKFRVKTKPRQPLNIDGHGIGKTPARFSIEPQALSVMVPPEFSGLP